MHPKFIFYLPWIPLAFAGEPCHPSLQQQAVEYLYPDSEIRFYICPSAPYCSIQEFTNGLHFNSVRLRANQANNDALEVTPEIKGINYFTAIFAVEQCQLRPVLEPDLSSSGAKILEKSSNGMQVIRSTDRSSRAEWSEIDHIYNPKTNRYEAQNPICYALIASRTVKIKCE